MFCSKCGEELNDEAVVCPKCGCPTQNYHKTNTVSQIDNSRYEEAKTGVGVLAGLFLGLIGLLIGCLVYPAGTESRRTFMKSCGITCIIQVVFTIIITIILVVAPLAMYDDGNAERVYSNYLYYVQSVE